MKVAGIVLLCLHVVALLGSIVNGNLLGMGIFELIGFFLPTIIGVILLVKAKKKSNQ